MRFLQKILLVVFAVCLSIVAFAQVDTLWQKANTLYTTGKYAEASEALLLIEKEGKINATLYYNIANAYYKQNEIAKAILYYERAFKLNPLDEDTRYNLELARMQTVDKIEPVPEFFIVSWIRAARNFLSIDAWAFAGLSLFAMVLLLALLVVFGKTAGRKKIAFFTGLVLLCISVFATYTALSKRSAYKQHAEAIIFAPVTSVKASPDNFGVDLFVLHEGTKVLVLETIGDWKKVKTADGNQGWLPAGTIEAI